MTQTGETIFQVSLQPGSSFIWVAALTAPGGGIIDYLNHKTLIKIEIYPPFNGGVIHVSIYRDRTNGSLILPHGPIFCWFDDGSMYDGNKEPEKMMPYYLIPDPEFSLEEIHQAQEEVK